ncbi:MAG: superoxide dismutase [Candidatus Polarisedimenticolia bacterium]
MADTTIYAPRDYARLRGLKGITDEQIEVHLTLYEGYVKRSNALLQSVTELRAKNRFASPEFAEQNRRLGWELNGMRLHELYFDGLKPGGSGALDEQNPLGAAAARQFGGVKAFEADLMGVAKMPGVGWAITYADPITGRLVNLWIEQHHAGHPAGWSPVVVLDVWEHAFSVYLKPTQREKYLEDFFANVDWQVAAQRMGEPRTQSARMR